MTDNAETAVLAGGCFWITQELRDTPARPGKRNRCRLDSGERAVIHCGCFDAR
jgi:hypothetical protein